MSISKRHIKKFEKLVNQLQDLLDEIQETTPEANIYLESEGGMMLLNGPSHVRTNAWDSGTPQFSNVVIAVPVFGFGGGGW